MVPEQGLLVSQQNHIVLTGTCWSGRIMIICQGHHPLPGSSSSAKIMILFQQHHDFCMVTLPKRFPMTDTNKQWSYRFYNYFSTDFLLIFRCIWSHFKVIFSILSSQIFDFSKSVRNRPENTPKPSPKHPQTIPNPSQNFRKFRRFRHFSYISFWGLI